VRLRDVIAGDKAAAAALLERVCFGMQF